MKTATSIRRKYCSKFDSVEEDYMNYFRLCAVESIASGKVENLIGVYEALEREEHKYNNGCSVYLAIGREMKRIREYANENLVGEELATFNRHTRSNHKLWIEKKKALFQ